MKKNSSEEIFINLTQIIRDDKDFHKFFDRLTESDPLKKNLIITEIAALMKEKGLAQNFIDSVKILNKPGICERIQSLYKEDSTGIPVYK